MSDNLEEISKYKDEIIVKILENVDLVKAIAHTDENFLSKSEISEPFSLIYENIYPHEFIPELNTDAKTIINVDIDGIRFEGRKISSVNMTIDVITHVTLFKTGYGTTRVDYIIGELYKLFAGSRGSWIGELNRGTISNITVNPKFSGKGMYFSDISNFGS